MSGVLARLVARAAGREASGVRPRRTSRFELAGPLAPAEPSYPETVAAAPAPPAAVPGGRAPANPRPDTPGAAQAPAPSLPVEPPSAPDRPARRAGPLDGVEVRAAAAMPPPERSAAKATPAPAAPREAPVENRLRVETRQSVERVEVALPGRGTPVPLFATPTRPTLLQAPVRAPAELRPGAATATATAREPAAAVEPPEIVISIGRIEVKAASPAEKAKRPRRERPAMTRLGDYLGGGGRA